MVIYVILADPLKQDFKLNLYMPGPKNAFSSGFSLCDILAAKF